MVAGAQNKSHTLLNEPKNQLTELPPDVRRKLFSFLAPRDAAQLFCVCKSLRQAALDELVWENFTISRWKTPHTAVLDSWKSLYVSGNGWGTAALRPRCVDSFPQARNLRWKFETCSSESKGGAILKWARESCQCLTSPQPDSASSWTFQGNIDCDRAISGCCMLPGDTQQVAVGDVYGNLIIQKPHTPFPVTRTGQKRPRGERGSPQSSSFKVSCAEELRGPRDFLVAEGGKQLWLLADAEAGFSGRVAVVDIEAQRSASCRDFMDGFVYHGLCGHPSNPQVAVVIGAHRSSVCPSCTHQEIAEPMFAPLWSAASLCGHRSREAMICITDMRAPQIVDRCNLPSVSVLPQIAACPGRDHYVFTSHHDCAVCAWDVRNLVYPAHSQRLNHRVEPRRNFGTHAALWRAPNQAMALSCSHDTMLGQAGNGMVWHFDLSAMLGWAKPCSSQGFRRGCWLTHRGSSEAAPGSWAHPTPVGVIPGNMESCKAIYVLPDSPHGAFFASGWSDCRLRAADAAAVGQDPSDLGLHGPDLVSGHIHGSTPMDLFHDPQTFDANSGAAPPGGSDCGTHLSERDAYGRVDVDSTGGCGSGRDVVGVGEGEGTQQPHACQGGACRENRGFEAARGRSGRAIWQPGESIWREGALSVVDWKAPFGINLYTLQPCAQ